MKKVLIGVIFALFGVVTWILYPSNQSFKIAVFSTSPVLEAKLTNLKQIAKDKDINLDGFLVEKLPKNLNIKQYDFIILDAPGSHNARTINTALSDKLEDYNGLLLQTGRSGVEAKNIDAQVADILHKYYHNGSSLNFANMFDYINYKFLAKGTSPKAPKEFPDFGIYHPEYKDIIFENSDDYLSWLKADKTKPIIAIAIHKNYIASQTTKHIDTVIQEIKLQGATPLAFYDSVVSDEGIQKLLIKDDKVIADALISMQIVLAPNIRKKVFEKLGINVLHTILYRDGDEKAWEDDRIGMNVTSIPFFLTNAEQTGMIDPMTIGVVDKDGNPVAIDAQMKSVVNKALSYAELKNKQNQDKKIALMFYNYPVKESGISASFMNVTKSVEKISQALKENKYKVDLKDDELLRESLSSILKGVHRLDSQTLLDKGLAEVLDIKVYEKWFSKLPLDVQKRINTRWGEAKDDPYFLKDVGFVIPRLKLQNFIVMPQPPRGSPKEDAENAIYHDMNTPVNHYYLANYLYVRELYKADALIHFGTHGSQEWSFGKERGLSVYDDPFLTIGDIPIIYPYIIDNIGEAIQTKRRGRATNITHMTPPLVLAGLYGELSDIHHLIHNYEMADKGGVKQKIQEQIIESVKKNETLDKDLGLTEHMENKSFDLFLVKLHDYLHEIAGSARPAGLHTFGSAPEDDKRIMTVMQMQGVEDEESVAVDFEEIKNSKEFLHIKDLLIGKKIAQNDRDKRALEFYEKLSGALEMPRLLDALNGKYIPTGYGGDPIRNPDSLPSGFNHTGFDPTRVPTKAAWEAGKEAINKTIEAYKQKHNKMPTKLAFTMWSVETMRHFGVLEAQVFYALGVEPVWDARGKISGVKIIKELQREPIDVVVSATGLYRDQFPNLMLRINEAVDLVSSKGDNIVARNTAQTYQKLLEKGKSKEQAKILSRIRVFSNESGLYGSKLEDATLASDTWESEDKLAKLYLNRMQYAFGAGLKDSGEKVNGLNLYSENLKGTDAAILSRSSNLYGMLTTDDPFQYLGGLSLAVRHLDGKSPEVLISNLRDAKNTKVQTGAEFLATELATREFHPGYIKDLMKEGASGSLSMAGTLENFWGWQVVDPDMVRDDQWKRYHDIYVKDAHDLNLTKWIEKQNPEVLKQMVDRMLESVRKEYWDADEQTLKSLLQKHIELTEKYDLLPMNEKLEDFIKDKAAGFGLNMAGQTQKVKGQELKKVDAQSSQEVPWLFFLMLGLMLLMMILGASHQYITQKTKG